MAEARSPRKPTKETHNQQRQTKQSQTQKLPHGKPERRPSWVALRSLFTCKHQHPEGGSGKCKKIGCSGSLCSSKESTGVLERPETPSSRAQKKWAGRGMCVSAGRSMKAPPPDEFSAAVSSSSSSLSSCSSSSLNTGFSSSFSSSSSLGGSFRGLQLRRLSGCYECHMGVDPVNGIPRDPSLRSITPCPDCGDIFMKSESLELHQAVRHAVLELGPDDSSRNIVEIIFQSSWLKKEAPVCKIERVLKINNTQKKISSFESYRDSIKGKANELPKKHPRCMADGNELLRFHCTSFSCAIGLAGTTHLCQSIPHCNLCSIIRDGFEVGVHGKIPTMATSGRAHDAAQVSSGEEKRAMLVCRVIAGRVKRSQEAASLEEYDSVSGPAGVYSNVDELFVFNPEAILPCFVVIYVGF